MSNHEKEIEEALMNCIGNHDGVCSMTVAFKAGAKWQASLVTEEKILEIIQDAGLPTKDGHELDDIAKAEVCEKIIALIKGHDEK